MHLEKAQKNNAKEDSRAQKIVQMGKRKRSKQTVHKKKKKRQKKGKRKERRRSKIRRGKNVF